MFENILIMWWTTLHCCFLYCCCSWRNINSCISNCIGFTHRTRTWTVNRVVSLNFCMGIAFVHKVFASLTTCFSFICRFFAFAFFHKCRLSSLAVFPGSTVNISTFLSIRKIASVLCSPFFPTHTSSDNSDCFLFLEFFKDVDDGFMGSSLSISWCSSIFSPYTLVLSPAILHISKKNQVFIIQE